MKDKINFCLSGFFTLAFTIYFGFFIINMVGGSSFYYYLKLPFNYEIH